MTRSRSALFLVCLCVVLTGLCSCTSALMCRLKGQSPGVAPPPVPALSSLSAAFSGPDYAAVTLSQTSAAAMDKRMRPATTVAGKNALCLAECRSIALSRSLEIQQAHIEAMTQKAIAYSNRTKLVPRFIFSGELSERDNEAFSYSEVLGQEGVTPVPGAAGVGVNQFSTGRERTTWRYVLETRWSPTDAALAYYLTRSGDNDSVKQNLMRIRISQKLLGVVDSSFYRLLSLQRIVPMAQNLVKSRTEVAGYAEKLFREKLSSAEDFHRVEGKLIKSKGLLVHLENELRHQRNILASAMNMSPDTCVDGGFFLAGDLKVPVFNEPVCNLEMLALKCRPESFKAGLDHLNTVNDLKRTIVKFCPRVTGFWRYTRDKDKHLYEKDWKDIGVLVYFDLVDWYSNLWENRATKLMVARTEKEIGAVALGITSQVRTAAVKFDDAMGQVRTAAASLQSSEKVLRIQRDRVARQAQEKLVLMESEGDVLQEQIEQTRAIGEANGMLGELQASVGSNYQEPLPR